MFNHNSLWQSLFLFLSSISLTIAINNHRQNLAQRHPCYSVNKRLESYIKWTERLVSTQYRGEPFFLRENLSDTIEVQKDACGQMESARPACCTNEIFNSYAITLGTDLKSLSDTELGHLQQSLIVSNTQIDIWTKEYLIESRRITISSLETLFGTKEYHSNIHHVITTLFTILANPQSTDDDVLKSAVHLFNQLLLSSYRRFMTDKSDLILDDQLQKCLIYKATDIEAFPTQRELLYTITSAASLTRILRTLFLYIDADIQRLKTTVTLNSQQCLQRYVREALCPICVDTSASLSSSIHHINEPLCENDCQFLMKTCFNESNNPYVAFALIAQGYSNIIKQIQESIVELKLVERLSKLHIYLYDMVINATNTRQTYLNLQTACPNSHEKSFSPILSLSPIINERRELVTQWNESLHFLLDQLQSSIAKLNTSLTQQIITEICLNSNYAVKSNRCIQIDQHTPVDFSQWPLPASDSSLSNPAAESTQNQIDELNKKLEPIEQVIISFRPTEKVPLIGLLPEFDYDNELDINSNDHQLPSSLAIETYENNDEELFSDQLYKQIDKATTRRTTTQDYSEEKNSNHSQLMTYNITLYLILFIILIVHRISFK